VSVRLSVCLFVHLFTNPHQETEHNFTRHVHLEKDKTTERIKWPTLSRRQQLPFDPHLPPAQERINELAASML